VRDLPEELMNALAEKAARAGMSREALVRQIIGIEARRPDVAASYEVRFSEVTDIHESVGYIVRRGDAAVHKTVFNPTVPQLKAFHEAVLLISQNRPGDRERAIAKLSKEYPQVELGPVTTPPVESYELGILSSGTEIDVLVRTDGTIWQRPASLPHQEWAEVPIGTGVGIQIYGALKSMQGEVEGLQLQVLNQETDAGQAIDYSKMTVTERLVHLHDEAKRRLPYHPQYRQVDDVQTDHFNIIAHATGLPRPITTREELDEAMPMR
jgi:hypothetical protein